MLIESSCLFSICQSLSHLALSLIATFLNTNAACKARVANKRVHFKHCREIGAAIQGMQLTAAMNYLENVLEKKEAVPFRVFTGGCGRHAQVVTFAHTHTYDFGSAQCLTEILSLISYFIELMLAGYECWLDV